MQYGETVGYCSGNMHLCWCVGVNVNTHRMHWWCRHDGVIANSQCDLRYLILSIIDSTSTRWPRSWPCWAAVDWLDRIHITTSSMQADICCWSHAMPIKWQTALICMSSAYRCRHRWFDSTSHRRSAVGIVLWTCGNLSFAYVSYMAEVC